MRTKIFRVVTGSVNVPWHLDNTLQRLPEDFDVFVVGEDVSQFKNDYPDVTFIDIRIARKMNILVDLLTLFSLCKLFIYYKPQIVHSIMPKAGLIAAISGFICFVPIRIHTFTGQTWATKSGVCRYSLRLIDKLINKLNTICLTDSISQSNFLFENKISFLGSPLLVLSKGSLSGVNIKRFNRASLEKEMKKLRDSLQINQNDFIFAFIARKTCDKGAIVMLNAFSLVSNKIQNCKLVFVGPDEDAEIERLRKVSPELFINVIDIGSVSNHESYLAIADVLCLPSFREGFGSIVIDAAALGIPTIGSNIPGLIDSIENGETGILFPLGDHYRMAEIMLELTFDDRLKKSLGDSARVRVYKFFSADILYKELKKLYLGLLESH